MSSHHVIPSLPECVTGNDLIQFREGFSISLIPGIKHEFGSEGRTWSLGTTEGIQMILDSRKNFSVVLLTKLILRLSNMEYHITLLSLN